MDIYWTKILKNFSTLLEELINTRFIIKKKIISDKDIHYTSYDYWKKIGYYFVVSTGFYTVKRGVARVILHFVARFVYAKVRHRKTKVENKQGWYNSVLDVSVTIFYHTYIHTHMHTHPYNSWINYPVYTTPLMVTSSWMERYVSLYICNIYIYLLIDILW